MNGLSLIKEAAARHPDRPVNVLAHCMRLTFVDCGSVLFSMFDSSLCDGVCDVSIEERGRMRSVLCVIGISERGAVERVLIRPQGISAGNGAFDVTPVRFISGFITERGVCNASEQGILSLYTEYA